MKSVFAYDEQQAVRQRLITGAKVSSPTIEQTSTNGPSEVGSKRRATLPVEDLQAAEVTDDVGEVLNLPGVKKPYFVMAGSSNVFNITFNVAKSDIL